MTDDLTPKEKAARRRRLAEVFGEVIPDQTADDTEATDKGAEQAQEDWLKRQVPPHHG
jgi:hypothetical protein